MFTELEEVQLQLDERKNQVQNHVPLVSLFFTFRRGMLPAWKEGMFHWFFG